jgi:DNA-binding NarL/FixJ family response regulator
MTNRDVSCYRPRCMPIRIFVFEDHWMCREALVSVLSTKKGIEVVGAPEDVQEGIEETIRLKPDVVLMDIRFHGENMGIGATSTIKEKLPETKVIIFTDYPDEQNLRDAVKAGASGYLLKKEIQDPDTIVEAIYAVYRGNAYMTPAITAKLLNVIKNLRTSREYSLTEREMEILRVIAEGKDNREIAGVLNIHVRTVANHVSNILYKINARNRTEAVAIARRDGLID